MTTAATLERQAIGQHLRTGFLGPAFDSTDLCPVAIPGVTFDATDAGSVTPFTPADVVGLVGYTELSLRNLGENPAAATSGVRADGQVASRLNTITRARFTFRVPAGTEFSEERLERYEEAVRGLFYGLSIRVAGPPKLYLRHLTHQHPPRTWRDEDQGDWLVRMLDIRIQRQETRYHAPSKEA